MEKEHDATPRKYPLRARTKVKYYDEFEPSLDEPKSKKNAKEDSDYEEGDEEEEKENNNTNEIEEEEISEYEKLRLKNLEENRRVMIELGLIDPMKIQRETEKLQKRKPKPKPRVKAPKPSGPPKRSLRLLKKSPEGKDLPFGIFQETPSESPAATRIEERTRIEEEVLPMNEDGESVDFLDSLKASLSQDSGISSQKSTDSLVKDMRNLQFAAIKKVIPYRVQGMCVHPMESKLLVIAGSSQGDLGLWNASEGVVAEFKPHLRAVNCISVSNDDHTKLFTTSHDGTVRRADITKSVFELVYQTDEKTKRCHITWHSQSDNNTLMVGHGTGDVGVIDLRSKRAERWFHCHSRSVRTVQQHPVEPYYFLTSSGIGEIKIWDVRGNKKDVDQCVSEFDLPKTGKGLTSAFFSPDGNKVVSTCNDDSLRIYDTSDVTEPREIHRVMHDNHTGRWLSVFKAVWHPLSSDLIFIGSMLHPRRVQLYSGAGRLVRELTDEQLVTVVPVLSLHRSLPVLVGGNSTGKAHIFTTPELRSLVKIEDDDND